MPKHENFYTYPELDLYTKRAIPAVNPYNAAAASPTASSAPGGRRSSPSPASSTSG